MIKIAIIDDHKLVSAGFTHLIELEDNLTVALSCQSVSEALEQLNNSIDVAIIDISMPEKNGIELAKYLQTHLPSIKKIIVSMYTDVYYIKAAKENGVLAYLSKKSAPDQLIDAIQAVSSSNKYYSQELLELLDKTPEQILEKPLTKREHDILKILAKGLSPKQVANELDIMPKTVLAHRYNLFNKFNVNNQFDLLQKALKFGLLTSADISLCSV